MKLTQPQTFTSIFGYDPEQHAKLISLSRDEFCSFEKLKDDYKARGEEIKILKTMTQNRNDNQRIEAMTIAAMFAISAIVIATFWSFQNSNLLVGRCLESGKYSFEECLKLR